MIREYVEASEHLKTVFRDILYGKGGNTGTVGQGDLDLFEDFLQILRSTFFVDGIRSASELHERMDAADSDPVDYPSDCRFEDIDLILQMAADRHDNLHLLTEADRSALGDFLLSDSVNLEKLFVAVGLNHDRIQSRYGLDFTPPQPKQPFASSKSSSKVLSWEAIKKRHPSARRLIPTATGQFKKAAASTSVTGDAPPTAIQFEDDNLKGFIQIFDFKKGQHRLSGYIQFHGEPCPIKLLLPDGQVIDRFSVEDGRWRFMVDLSHRIDLTAIGYECN